MRSLLLILVVASTVAVCAQTSPSTPPASKSQQPEPTPYKPTAPRTPNLAPPRSDSINADSLGDDSGTSSSKDTLIDLSPPEDDPKAHPQSSEILMAPERSSGNSGVGEFHPCI